MSPRVRLFTMRIAVPECVTPELYLRYIRNRFADTIKPWIDRGRYDAAREMILGLMGNIPLFGFEDAMKNSIHCGPELCKAAVFLEEMLATGDPIKIEVATEEFQAYAAQTALPKSPQ